MNKQIVGVMVLLFILLNVHRVDARLFFIGHNPHLSKIAFPQDIGLINYSFLMYAIGYEPLPFWGDVDNSVNKPNDDYTATEISISKSDAESGVQQFKTEGASYLFKHSLSYHISWSKKLKTMFSLYYNHIHMQSSASGNLPATNEDGSTGRLNFDYELSKLEWLTYLETIFAYRLGTIPVGLKIGIGYEGKEKPQSSLEATAQGTSLKSDRILWGWSTKGCNHIFGYKSVHGDAWYKNSYYTKALYQFDLQLGFTLPKLKFGSRYRYRKGLQHNYRWQASEDFGDDATYQQHFIENFSGSYEQSKWSDQNVEQVGRAYVNYTFFKNKIVKFNTLLFFAVDDYENVEVHKHDASIANDVKQSFTNYIIEFNPNMNLSFGRGIKIDMGILLEYAWTNFKNTYSRWNSYRGGEETTYWNSNVRVGDEPTWERFSFADEKFFDFGWETNVTTPVFKIGKHICALTTMLFANYKFTYMTKYYGENVDSGSSYSFDVNATRENYKREIWFNAAVSIFYKHNKLMVILTYVKPLVYALTKETRVRDKSGKSLYYKSVTMQTAVMDGGSVSKQMDVFGGNKITLRVGYML